MSRTIALTQGKSTTVDDVDYEWVMQWKWQAHKDWRTSRELYYVMRSGSRVNGRQPTFLLHREIAARAGMPWSPRYDHADGDGLNNRRRNIRPCTNGQNRHNSRKTPKFTSKLKGVHWSRERDKWIAQIRVNKIQIYLGAHISEKSAHKAYADAAKKYFGEYARS